MKQTDIYTEALICLRSILQADHPEFKNWIDWLERDIQDWNQRREVAHHLRAYGGMGSFNDLPSMRGNHDYIFDFLKSVCYAFGHLYGKREGISPEALMAECLHDAEQAAYHPHKALNQAIAQHLRQGDLQENLDTLLLGQAWPEVDFGTGKVAFLDDTQKEDMLQVEYPNSFLLDMGWYQNRYIISVIQNFDWTHPVQQYETAERNQLPTLLTEAVRFVEKASQTAVLEKS